jgi:hypothetical protein
MSAFIGRIFTLFCATQLPSYVAAITPGAALALNVQR